MRRREFIWMLGGGAAVWPLAAHGQQPAMPVIGFLNSASAGAYAERLRAFLQGLREAGFVEGRNVAIEYRWAGGQYDRLPVLATDLVGRQVNVIGGANIAAALAAKAATATIPIIFAMAADPVEVGLVASLSRPGGNLTGATTLNIELGPKRLEILHELVPTAARVAFLHNPTSPIAAILLRDMERAARTLRLDLRIVEASTEGEIDAVFAGLAQTRIGALAIATDPFFNARNQQFAALALRHALPTIFAYREYIEAGGLISFHGDVTDSYRLSGVYCGRILKGENPAELPVQQTTKVELIVNLKTARAIGLTVPLSLLGRADEVIE